MLLKVYVVLYMMGIPTAYVGSWPGDTTDEALTSCQSNEPASNKLLDNVFADPVKLAKIREETPGLQRKDIYWKCEVRDAPPALKNPVKMPKTE